jgi:hypothetical protein
VGKVSIELKYVFLHSSQKKLLLLLNPVLIIFAFNLDILENNKVLV